MCFLIGQMKGLTYMQYRDYQAAVNVFLKVQAYDTHVQSQRLNGDLTVSYYSFADSIEQTQYTQGRMLLIQNDPGNAAKYIPVEKL
jgi:hypothetical protein